MRLLAVLVVLASSNKLATFVEHYQHAISTMKQYKLQQGEFLSDS